MDAPSPTDYDSENYLVSLESLDLDLNKVLKGTINVTSLSTSLDTSDVALLDCATTQTILKDPKYFNFNGQWFGPLQTSDFNSIASKQKLQIYEG